MLEDVAERLGRAGYTAVELYVYGDNERATALYERLGWERVEEPPRAHSRTGKPEWRYRLELAE